MFAFQINYTPKQEFTSPRSVFVPSAHYTAAIMETERMKKTAEIAITAAI